MFCVCVSLTRQLLLKQVSKELVFDVGIWHIDSSVSGLTVEVIGESSRLQGKKTHVRKSKFRLCFGVMS